MEALNEYQRKAAEFKGKHLLVLAGAGTGKTKTIVARADYLIKTNIQPRNIAILSFTRKSAQAIAERVKTSASNHQNIKGIEGKTFHSWCNEIMHTYSDYFPQSKFTLLDEDDRISAMGLAVGKYFKDSQGEKLKAKSIVNIYSYAVNTLCSLSTAIKHIRYGNSSKSENELKTIVEKDKLIIAPIIKQYIDYKRTRRYVDYDDMLNVVADALEKNQIIKDAVTKRWQHILVDEMQDTNPLQYKLLMSFVEKSHLFCVGDDAQSIYAFRGADFKTIHSFSKIVPNSDVYKLLLNYRSTQEILDLSNWLLDQSPLNYDKKLKAVRGNGNRPQLIHTENDWEEANIITDEITNSVNMDCLKYSDFMVLGRSSWALSKVEGACLQKKIPYQKFGGTQLMQTAHVRDIVSALRIVANNYDEIAWIRFLKLWEGIGDVTATNIITHIITLLSFEEIIQFLKKSSNKNIINTIPITLEVISNHINNPSAAIHDAVKSMGKIMSKKYREEWDYRVSDFDVLEEVAKSSGSISEFITEYLLDPSADTTFKAGRENIKDVVTLSTIHSAKGLEAKSVHIINVNPSVYPSTRNILEGQDAVEEERRCLYVALTRAKDSLKLYRNKKSLHTQYQKDEEEIHYRGTYKTKTPDGIEVMVINMDDDKVAILNKENKKIEKIPKEEFTQKYVETESQESALYFLNKLPSNLVNMEVITQQGITKETNLIKTEPAKLPDFNFD